MAVRVEFALFSTQVCATLVVFWRGGQLVETPVPRGWVPLESKPQRPTNHGARAVAFVSWLGIYWVGCARGGNAKRGWFPMDQNVVCRGDTAEHDPSQHDIQGYLAHQKQPPPMGPHRTLGIVLL